MIVKRCISLIRVAYYEINVIRYEDEKEKCRIAVFKSGRLIKSIEADNKEQSKYALEALIQQILSEIYD